MGISGGFCAINSTTVAVKFATKVDKATAENTNNYSIIKVSGGSALNITGAKLQEDGKTVLLTLNTSSALTNVATNYTVHVHDILNANGEEIEEYSKVISLSDAVRPSVKEVKFADSKTIRVEFTEPVDLSSLNTAVAVYQGLTQVTVSPQADGNTAFTIDVSSLDAGKQYKLVINSNIDDFAGNVITPNPYETTFTVAADTTDPKVVSVEAINLQTLKVKFDEKIKDQDPGAGKNYFTIAIDDTIVTPTSVDPVADTNDKEFIVVLPTAVSVGLHKVTVKNFADVAGNPNPVTKSTWTQYINFAESGPALVSTVGEIKYIGSTRYAVFTFDRPIKEDTFAAVTAERVYDGVTYDVTIPAAAFNVKADIASLKDTELAIDLTSLQPGSYSFTLPGSAIDDVYGGNFKDTKVSFEVGAASTQVEVNATATEPTGSNPINGDTTGESIDQVIVTFTGEVGASALNPDNYTVEGEKVFASAGYYGNKNTVRLTLKPEAIKFNGKYNFAVKGVLDKNGKAVKDYTKLVQFAETVKPYIAEAKVTDLDIIEVIFSENITPVTGGFLDKNDLNVYVNGSKVAITSATFTGNKAVVDLDSDLTSTTAKVEVETAATFDGIDSNGNLGKPLYRVEAVWDIDDNSGIGVTGNLTVTDGTPDVLAQAPGDVVFAGLTFKSAANAKLNGYKFKLGTVADSTVESATVDTTNKVITINGDFDDTDGSGTFSSASDIETEIESATDFPAGADLDVTGTATVASSGDESDAFSGGVDAVAGTPEVATLAISGTAVVGGTVTVTVNGTAYTVTVSQGETASSVASKIKAALDGNVAGYTVTVSGSNVVFTADTNGDQQNLVVEVK